MSSSIRVARRRGTYTPLEAEAISASLPPPTTLGTSPESDHLGDGQGPTSPLVRIPPLNTNSVRSEPRGGRANVTNRPRSRTLASIFGTSTAANDNPTQPSENQNDTLRSPRRLRSASNALSESDRPLSWVRDSVARQSIASRNPGTVSTRISQPMLAVVSGDRSPSPKNRRDSVLSSESTPVEIIVPAGTRLSLPGSSQSLPRSSLRIGEVLDNDEHHEDAIVEHLDVIDAQIGTVAHLSNAANSILIPPLTFYNRRPVVVLPAQPLTVPDAEKGEAERDEIDRHVEDVLGRREKLKHQLRGLWTYLKTPVGILTAIYGFLVVFWGAAIVFFLAKFINLHNPDRQGFWVEVSSQVVNALFTIQGVGFIPWRAIDTYNIIRIWHYKRLDRRLRKKAGLPPLGDEDDLPDPQHDKNHIKVLSDQQQNRLRYHQEKFRHSQTWYRPHATETHKAFSINTAFIICILVDFNSVFQCMLCGVMWGLDRFNRPAWTVGSLIPLSFLCGIGAAIFIWRGGERAKKTEEVKARLQAALEEERKVLLENYGERQGNTGRGAEPALASIHIAETMSIPEDSYDPNEHPRAVGIPSTVLEKSTSRL